MVLPSQKDVLDRSATLRDRLRIRLRAGNGTLAMKMSLKLEGGSLSLLKRIV